MIRQDIDNMTNHRLAPTREKIESDIKYAYWHEFLCTSMYSELMELVRKRYNDIADQFME